MIFTIIISIAFYYFGFKSVNLAQILLSIVISFISICVYSFIHIKRRLILFLFSIFYFIYYISLHLYNYYYGNLVDIFTTSIYLHTLSIIYIGLISLYLSFMVFSSARLSINDSNRKEHQKYFESKVGFVAKRIFLVTYIFLIVITIEKVYFVQMNDFREYYISYVSIFPSFISKLADASIILFYVFLATYPSKKQIKYPVILFLIFMILSLGYGQRNVFALNVLLLFFYYYYRERKSANKGEWIKKKNLITILIIAPVMLVFFELFDYLRRDILINEISFVELFLNFFSSQGQTTNLISYGYLYENQIFNQSVPYSFGSIYLYLTQNVISRTLFGTPQLLQNTVEMALNGNSFGQTMTYILNPTTYLLGIGVGSSYLAELFFDFGVMGVILGSIFIGFVLSYFSNINKYRLLNRIIILIALRWILYLPRTSYFEWFAQTFSFLNIFIILSIFIIAKNLRFRRFKYGNNYPQ